MAGSLSHLKAWIVHSTSEERRALELVKRIPNLEQTKILDVGCGQGRFLNLLAGEGLNVTGVEINPALRMLLSKQGRTVLSPEEFSRGSETYDVLVFSHIVEHFAPEDLLEFLKTYLARLSRPGHVLVLTPLDNPDFYDDYDHIKPYPPNALIQLLSDRAEDQIQAHTGQAARLTELWFRRTPWRLKFYPEAILQQGFFVRGVNLFLALLFQISFRTFGKKDGWVGLFEFDGKGK